MTRKRDRAGSPGATGADKEANLPEGTAGGDGGEQECGGKKGDDAAKQLEDAQRKAQENFSRLQRVAADYDNYRKFAEREKSDALLKERSILLCGFIDAMENLERAIEAGRKELPPESGLMKGLQMTLDGIRAFLEGNCVRPIAAVGSKFDPQLHEAVYFISVPGKPEYTVAEELRRGYTINGKVLRTSKVSVVSRPELPEGTGATEENKT